MVHRKVPDQLHTDYFVVVVVFLVWGAGEGAVLSKMAICFLPGTTLIVDNIEMTQRTSQLIRTLWSVLLLTLSLIFGSSLYIFQSCPKVSSVYQCSCVIILPNKFATVILAPVSDRRHCIDLCQLQGICRTCWAPYNEDSVHRTTKKINRSPEKCT